MQAFRSSGFRVFRGWILCGGLLIGSAGVSAAETVTVPMTTLKTRHVVVPVTINGEGPFRLALDTGSPITFISNRVAKKTGMLDAKAAQSPALLGMRGQTATKSFAVGGAKLADFEVTILDHPVIDLLSQVDGPVDGIVGYSFFGRFRTTIDYAAGRVTFTPVKYEPKDVMRSLLTRLMQNGPQTVVQTSAALWGMEAEKSDEEAGVRVSRVYRESAADAAGLRVGDRLLTIEGRWTDTLTETYDALALIKPGQSVQVVISREGKRVEVSIKPRAGL